jgi:hypothetical protein
MESREVRINAKEKGKRRMRRGGDTHSGSIGHSSSAASKVSAKGSIHGVSWKQEGEFGGKLIGKSTKKVVFYNSAVRTISQHVVVKFCRKATAGIVCPRKSFVAVHISGRRSSCSEGGREGVSCRDERRRDRRLRLTFVTSAKARGDECALDTRARACRSRLAASQAPAQGAERGVRGRMGEEITLGSGERQCCRLRPGFANVRYFQARGTSSGGSSGTESALTGSHSQSTHGQARTTG